MNPAQGSSNLLTGLNNTARGQGAEQYRGEGGIATGGEYHNALEPFLGPPTKAVDYEPSFRFPHEAWFLPDAYQGRNDYIRETIVQTVVNHNAFMTTEILPWRQQDNPNIAWDSIKFDKTLIDLEPEQGVPRYVTVERESHTDYMVRRGLALIVNHGFAATPGGQKDFMYKVATIAGAVQETCDQSGLVALLRSKNEYRGHLMESIRTAADAYDMFHQELWRFGIIQHSERGWYHMDAEAEHVMQLENIQPDTWIVPSRMTSYAAYGQLAETEVWRAGEKVARGNLEMGKDRFTTFRGKSVYETRPFQLDVDGRIVDPLNRNRMIGDFFVVPFYELKCFQSGGNALWPVAEEGQTQAYCCDSDRFETFTWKDMNRLSEFGDVSADLFRSHQDSSDFSFEDIETFGSGQGNYIGFMRAIAIHEALRRAPTSTQGSNAINDLLLRERMRGAGVDNEKWNDFLPSFLHGYNLDMGLHRNAGTPAQQAEREKHRTAECHPIQGRPSTSHVANPIGSSAPSRGGFPGPQMKAPNRPADAFSDSTREAIQGAVRLAVHTRCNVDPNSADQCASTWGKALSQNGIGDEDCLRHMTAAMNSVAEDTIATAATESPEQLNNLLHRHPDTGALLSQEEVSREIHNSFLDDSFDLLLSEAEDRALKLARSGVPVTHSGHRHVFDPEPADPNLPWDAVPQDGVTATYPLHRFGEFMAAIYNRGKDAFERGETHGHASAQDAGRDALHSMFHNDVWQGLQLVRNDGATAAAAPPGSVARDLNPQDPLSTFHGAKNGEQLQRYYKGSAKARHPTTGAMVRRTGGHGLFTWIEDNPVEAKRWHFILHGDRNFDKWNPGNVLHPITPGLPDVRHSDPAMAPEMGGYDILCLRPFRQYTMGTGILLKKGSELGNTFRGWADFQLTDNIIAKTHIGHFSELHLSGAFWHASIVTNPKCLFLAEDIFCTNYISGEGSKPLSWRYINDFQNDPLGTMNKHNASIICLPVPIGAIDPVDKRLQMNNPISLTGVLDPIMRSAVGNMQAACVNIGDYELNGKSRRVIGSLQKMWDAAKPDVGAFTASPNQLLANPRPYVSSEAAKRELSGQTYSDMYSALFGFHNMNHDVDYENSRTYETACRVTNTMCFHTMQKMRNPLNNRWEVTNLNTGHFGENGIYEGVKKIRSGYLDYFKDMQYQKAMGMGGLSI